MVVLVETGGAGVSLFDVKEGRSDTIAAVPSFISCEVNTTTPGLKDCWAVMEILSSSVAFSFSESKTIPLETGGAGVSVEDVLTKLRIRVKLLTNSDSIILKSFISFRASFERLRDIKELFWELSGRDFEELASNICERTREDLEKLESNIHSISAATRDRRFSELWAEVDDSSSLFFVGFAESTIFTAFGLFLSSRLGNFRISWRRLAAPSS